MSGKYQTFKEAMKSAGRIGIRTAQLAEAAVRAEYKILKGIANIASDVPQFYGKFAKAYQDRNKSPEERFREGFEREISENLTPQQVAQMLFQEEEAQKAKQREQKKAYKEMRSDAFKAWTLEAKLGTFTRPFPEYFNEYGAYFA